MSDFKTDMFTRQRLALLLMFWKICQRISVFSLLSAPKQVQISAKSVPNQHFLAENVAFFSVLAENVDFFAVFFCQHRLALTLIKNIFFSFLSAQIGADADNFFSFFFLSAQIGADKPSFFPVIANWR